MKIISNYIGGKLTPPNDNTFINNYDPSCGDIYGKVPNSNISDVNDAVDAANKAFTHWSKTSINERSRILAKIADLIEERCDELAIAESLDNGKPVWLAKKVDIPRAASNFRFFSHAITQFATKAHEMHNGINYTLRQPIGVVGTISPWNLPLYLFSWKIAPAIASGNTVVAKPSEVTPMTAYLLSKICIEAGLPAGVLNIVHGTGKNAGSHITQHKDVKAISFTGSTNVGREIAKTAVPQFKKISLEMGGKNPNVIFADCDYEKMLDTTIRSSFANQGQICLCGSRIFIEKSLYDKFKGDFIARTKELKVGHPKDDLVNQGAVVSEAHYNKILNCIERARKEGGSILTGGKSVHPKGYENGWYIAPTIIENLPYNCATNQEEIFGPVVTIMPFESEDEVVNYANSTVYGLSATIWTQDISKANRMAKRVEAGIVWVNTWLLRDLRTPFGGVKSSGIGREGGFEALRFFTEPKNICVQF